MYSLVLIIALGVAVLLYTQWLKLPTEQRSRMAKKYVIWIIIAVLLLAVATGRGHWLMALLAGGMAFADRLLKFAGLIPLLQKLVGAEKATDSKEPSNAMLTMTPEHAAKILGVDIKASEQEIITAHRSLMLKVHPDRGGTDALAVQLNQAKDVLLK